MIDLIKYSKDPALFMIKNTIEYYLYNGVKAAQHDEK